MDLFGEILLSLKIEAHAIGTFTFGETWGFSLPARPPIYAHGFTCTDKAFTVTCDGHASFVLAPGDSVLLLHGVPFSVGSTREAPCIPLMEFWQEHGLPALGPDSRWDAPVNLHFGEGVQQGRLLSTVFVLQDSAHSPLLAELPQMIVLQGSARELFPWMPSLLHFLATEQASTKPGYLTTATRLAELVLSSFIRAHLLSAPRGAASWLNGVADKRIGKALACIHTNPGKPWTTVTLAAQTGMSRFAFARRFIKVVGKTPIDYLIRWRMHIAAEEVILGKKSVSAISESLGYRSERAFREAFKLRFGMSPLQYAKAKLRNPMEDALPQASMARSCRS